VRLWLCVALCLAGAATNAVLACARPTAAVSAVASCPRGKEDSPVHVLVANRLIRKGLLGPVIVKRQMYDSFILPCWESAPGPIDDPADLVGLVAAQDIFPGQQLARAEFSGVIRESLTSPVRVGRYASLTVTVAPRARCTIRVVYANVASKASGLVPKTGGRITWRWRVGTNTAPGRWPIIVRCGASGLLRFQLRVVAR
jgi:hypothetical protein